MGAAAQPWRRCGAVIAMALVMRLIAAVAIDHEVSRTPGRLCLIAGDAEGYWMLADNLLHGEYSIYEPARRVLRMPGFPLLLAACQWAWGENVLAARCVLSTVGALGCGAVYWLGKELTASEFVATTAGIAAAVSPALVAFSPLLLSETAFATTLTIHLFVLAKLGRGDELTTASPRWMLSLCAGLLGALATFMRPTWLPVTPVAALAFVASCCWLKPGCSNNRGASTDQILEAGQREQRRFSLLPSRGLEALTVLFGLSIGLSPWVIRNTVVTGHVVITTLWDGPSLYDGLHPGATGDSDMTFFERDQLLATMSEFDMNRTYRDRAWAFVREQPGRTMQLAWNKAVRFWSVVPNAAQFRSSVFRWGLALSTLPLFVLAVIGGAGEAFQWFAVPGTVRRSDRLRTLACTAGPILFLAAVHLLFVSSVRYRLPAETPLWILAAIGLQRLRFLSDVFSRQRPLTPMAARPATSDDGGRTAWDA